MSNENVVQRAPAIAVYWDDQAKVSEVRLDLSQLRHPGFALRVMDMATESIKDQLKMAQAQAFAHAQAQAQRDEQLVRQMKLVH